jgi:hypothetical protein
MLTKIHNNQPWISTLNDSELISFMLIGNNSKRYSTS